MIKHDLAFQQEDGWLFERKSCSDHVLTITSKMRNRTSFSTTEAADEHRILRQSARNPITQRYNKKDRVVI